MSGRIWHVGPPPHVGWWNASVALNPRLSNAGDLTCWRWWNGAQWSWSAWPHYAADYAANMAGGLLGVNNSEIFWTNYWPESARVPRVDPSAPAEVAKVPCGVVSGKLYELAQNPPEQLDSIRLNLTSPVMLDFNGNAGWLSYLSSTDTLAKSLFLLLVAEELMEIGL